jgi:hypothetical protein
MSGNLVNPEAMLEILRQSPEADRRDYKTFGTLLCDMPDPVEQTRWCEAAVACHRTDAAAYLGLADAWAHAGMGGRTRMLGRVRLGIGILERGLIAVASADPRRKLIHTNLAFLYNEVGRPDLAEQHGRLSEGAPNHIYHLWLAEALFARKNFTPDSLCCFDLGTFRQERMQALADEASALWGDGAAEPTDNATLLLSTDPVYFKKFAVAQAASLYKLKSKIGIHFHIINPDEECRVLVTEINQRLSGIRVSFSFENQNNYDLSNNVYYACCRLIIAYRMMEKLKTNIVIADADILFRSNPEDLLKMANGYDLATIHYHGEPMCNRYNASFFFIRRSLMGVYFLRVLEDFLITTFARGMLWMVDQLALYFCERRIAAVTGGALRTLEWPESVVAIHHHPLSEMWDGQPDAPIWSGATSAKWRDTPYTRYQNELLAEHGFAVAPSGA